VLISCPQSAQIYLDIAGVHPPLKVRTKVKGAEGTQNLAIAAITTAGTSGPTDPTSKFKAIGQTVKDGTCTWTVIDIKVPLYPILWQPNYPYTIGALCTSTDKVKPSNATKTGSANPTQQAPGPAPNTNPAATASFRGTIYKKHPRVHTPAEVRRQWLAWCSNYWRTNPWILTNGFQDAAPAIKIIDWQGNQKTPTPYQLYMAQSGILLGWDIPYWVQFGIDNQQMVYASYYDYGWDDNPFGAPVQPYWPAPIVTAASATHPATIVATIQDPSVAQTPNPLKPILVALYATGALTPRSNFPSRKLQLIAAGWINAAGPPPWDPNHDWITLAGGTWGYNNGPDIGPKCILPNGIWKLKPGQRILIGARTLRNNGNLSAWTTQYLTVA